MRNQLAWKIPGETFEDGSRLADWKKIASFPWQWQYDTHELAFDIYEHDGGYWKLYRTRSAQPGADSYQTSFGGQACRMTLVEYRRRTGSPHSRLLKEQGELEWVRVEEVDLAIHRPVMGGESTPAQGVGEEDASPAEIQKARSSATRPTTWPG